MIPILKAEQKQLHEAGDSEEAGLVYTESYQNILRQREIKQLPHCLSLKLKATGL